MSMCLWCFLDLDVFSSLRHVYTGFCIRFIVSIWRDFSYRVMYIYIYIMYPPRFDGRAAVYFNPDISIYSI